MIPTRFLAAAFTFCSAAALHAQRPAGWQVLPDRPSPDSAVAHVAMPPGWHITTGPAAVVFSAANTASGRFSVESELFLFPSSSNEELGVFLGGDGLSEGRSSWIAFVVRRDGSAGVARAVNGAVEMLVPWAKSEAVKPHPGGKVTVKHVLRVTVETDSVYFHNSGAQVLSLPRSDLRLDGVVGFRVGEQMNAHITTLDVTRRLAPTGKAH